MSPKSVIQNSGSAAFLSESCTDIRMYSYLVALRVWRNESLALPSFVFDSLTALHETISREYAVGVVIFPKDNTHYESMIFDVRKSLEIHQIAVDIFVLLVCPFVHQKTKEFPSTISINQELTMKSLNKNH